MTARHLKVSEEEVLHTARPEFYLNTTDPERTAILESLPAIQELKDAGFAEFDVRLRDRGWTAAASRDLDGGPGVGRRPYLYLEIIGDTRELSFGFDGEEDDHFYTYDIDSTLIADETWETLAEVRDMVSAAAEKVRPSDG